MAFVQLLSTSLKLDRLRRELAEEKVDAVKIAKKEKPRWKLRHLAVDMRVFFRRFFRRALSCFFFEKCCYNLRHHGSCENFTLRSVVGFLSGYLLTYVFFMFCVFQLNFKLTTATVMCSILGCILTIGLAFSTKVRCIVLLTLPQFFSQRGRQALLAYAFILAISGPAKNTLNNLGILSESLACGQEQLKAAVRQIIDAIKKPFIALKEAIKKLVKTVKEIVKKIKEILLTIKRIIMAIIRVIKAAFEFLAKIISICNKELGTPFERCSRVFENAIADCNAKLGPLFNWLCSITYIVKSVCYLVKFLDFICILVDFISNSVIGVVIRKVKTFIRHIKTMFYVRIKFSHSFQFQTNSSRTVSEIAHEIVGEIRERTRVLAALFTFMTSAATLFFVFMIVKVTYYRIKFLTSEKFDNRFITKDFREIDMRRAKHGKETVLPLNNREMTMYVSMDSKRLAKTEKKALSKAVTTLASASLKLAIFLAVDYCLFWILNLIKYYGRFQSKVQAPNVPRAYISGNGLLADLLRGIVRAFQPMGIQLEIDTVPCLPTPIPPNYDRYVQIATLLVLCWVLTLLEPYGLRLRNMIMCYYHPTRAKERAIWLYNHIMRSRNSFLKFARRQLRRKFMGEKGIEKVTCKEFLAANFKVCRFCLGEGLQTACLLCGQVFRESDNKKPIRCQTPGCPGTYCEQCFSDLQNLCTLCLSPIEYGDMSDISEEKDSSDEEPKQWPADEPKKKDEKKKKRRRWWCFKGREEDTLEEDLKTDEKDMRTSLLGDASSDEQQEEYEVDETKEQPTEKPRDSDYYSSDESTDYSYSYQYDKSPQETQTEPPPRSFKDVEKQEMPDYASMESFREDFAERLSGECVCVDDEEPETFYRASILPAKKSVGTILSGTTFDESRKQRHIDFIGVSSSSSSDARRKPLKRIRREEEIPLIRADPSLCLCSDSDDSDLVEKEVPAILLPRSTTSTTTDKIRSLDSTSSDDDTDEAAHPDLDPEVKDDLRYVHMLVPQLDLSELTESRPSSKKSYAEDLFSHVSYEEVSESPPTSSSSQQLYSSTNISSIKKNLLNIPDKQEEQMKKDLVDKGTNTEEKEKIQPRSSAISVGSYDFENNQKRRVKQYYKAIRDIPSEKVAEKRKPNKFVRFFQKLFTKRKTDTDELPLYSTGKEVVELKSYNYSGDKWDALSTSLSSSALVGQDTSDSPPNLTSSEEEDEEKRVRGGESGLFGRSLSTSYKSGYIPLKELSNSPRRRTAKRLITKDLLSKYFVSIEDLTPTRDCGPMTTAKTLRSNSESYRKGEVLTEEIPEKDEPTESRESLPYTVSSTLSEGLIISILGRPKKITPTQPSTAQNLPVDTLFFKKTDLEEEIDSVTREAVRAVSAQNAHQPEESRTETIKTITTNIVKPNSSKSDLLQTATNNIVGNNDPKRSSVASQVNVESEKIQREDSRNSKDQKSQTFPSPILKHKSSSGKNLVTIKEPTVDSNISLPGAIQPQSSDTATMNPPESQYNHKKMETDRQPVRDKTVSVPCKILLTSDKTQQTSDDDVRRQPSDTNVYSGGYSNRATVGSYTTSDSTRARTPNLCNKRTSTFIEATENIQASSSSNIYECQCPEPRIADTERCGRCGRRPASSPRYGEYANLKEKCYRNMSPTPEVCTKYPDRQYRCVKGTSSEHTVRSKARSKICKNYPTDDSFSVCESQCKGTKVPQEAYSSERSSRSRPLDSDCSGRRTRSPGNAMSTSEEYECCMRSRKPRPVSNPPYRCPPPEFESDSSEFSDVPDEDDYYEDHTKRFDLPYQNSDDYLELVQELEETLQSRNRNRVRRAMQEFEHRSRCNKPLDQPILNYDETSESEEPIIEKLTQLTSERRRCCGGEMCSCRRRPPCCFGKGSHGKGRERSQPRSGGYSGRSRPPDPCIKTRWQLDKNSGEWYKVTEVPQRCLGGRRSRTPSPRRDYCPHNCKCCGSKRHNYR